MELQLSKLVTPQELEAYFNELGKLTPVEEKISNTIEEVYGALTHSANHSGFLGAIEVQTYLTGIEVILQRKAASKEKGANV